MARTKKGAKCPSHEYWGKRMLSCCIPGRISKKITMGMERAKERDELRKVMNGEIPE